MGDKPFIWELSNRIPGEHIMFTSIFSHKRAGRAVSAFMVLLGAAFVFGTLSCKQATDSETETTVQTITGSESFIGTWTSSYNDSYAITSSSVTYYDGGYGYDWVGTPVGKYEISSTSGYIYVEYTSVCSGMDSSLDGTYIAVSYKNLSASTSAQMATAYKSGGAGSESTLSAAVTEFTIDNGYYSSYGSYSYSE